MDWRPRHFHHLWVVATLLLGAVFTLCAVVQREHANAAFAKERFETESRELADAIVTRFAVYEYGLRSARGLMQHAGEYGVSSADFRRYMRSRDLEREFPGAHGFGFIHRVSPQALPGHDHAHGAALGRPMRMLTPHEGEHFIVELVEPFEQNSEALGLDVAGEPNRRQAAIASMRSGRAVMTPPITLVQVQEAQHRAFGVMLPLYHAGRALDTPDEREAAAYGWTFVSVVTDDVLAGLPLRADKIALTLTDITETEHAVEFYSTLAMGEAPHDDAQSASLLRVPYGRSWMVRTEMRPNYAAQFALLPPRVVAWVGALLTLLVASLQWVWLAMRRRQQEARALQQRLATIVENASDAMVGQTLGGEVVLWNAAAEQLFGWRREEAMGRRMRDLLLPPERAVEDRDLTERLAHGEKVLAFDSTLLARDGRLCDVAITPSAITDHRGRVVGVARLVRDIALRKAHEQRLLDLNAGLEQRVRERTSSLEDVEQFLRTVLDAVPSMISYWDRDKINRAANRANLEWRRPDGGSIVGLSVREVVGEATYARLKPYIDGVTHGQPQSFEVPIVSPLTGEERELHVRYLPDLRGGEVEGYYAIAEDVTERNRNRRALEAALAQQATERVRLQSILQGTNVGTWEWNVQTGECRYNERWAQMIGHDYDVLRPADIRAWIDNAHPDDLPPAHELLKRHFSGELDFYESEVRMRHVDGRWVWVLNRGQLRTRTADGQPEWMYGTQTDISASKAIEQHLRDAKRAAEAASASKSAFLANMSHEIRTPLNAVLGVAHLLADSPLNDDQRGLLGKAQAAGRSLLGIVNDVLDLAKIEAGEMRLADDAFSPGELLRELESVYAVQASDKGLTLTLQCDAALPAAMSGDAARLRQILINLVGNALKFTQHGGVVIAAKLLRAEAEPRLRLSVRDSGIGITPEQQERLFQPFTQADETTTRRFGGTGLGLSIVRRLVELMHGEVGLLSTPGLGSEFWISVPLHEADAADLPVVVRERPSGRSLSGLRVLLVDDSDVNLDIAQRMLEREGARVSKCGDGAQALAWLQRSPGAVDVVLMDVQMPVMDGLEATRHIRGDVLLQDLPVIALTAGALSAERQRALDAGFSDFVAKPLDPAELLSALRRACPHAELAEPATGSGLPADWPVVDGIDAVAAHRQLGGDLVLFERVLTRLLAEHADWAALVPDVLPSWDAAQRSAWRARAHRLRGSAGMLGALELSRAAARLETAFDDALASAAVPPLVEVQLRFGLLVQGAAGLSASPAAPVEQIAPLDEAQWQQGIDRLTDQLASNDLDAGTSFVALRAAIAQRLGAESAKAIATAIDNLDFEQALACLEDDQRVDAD